MADINFNKYSNKKPYNNLPLPEGAYLAPFYVTDWDEVRQMNYCRENLETWHFSGIGVLVAFTPVSEAQFPVTLKLFWSKVRHHIANLGGNPNMISYDKMLDDMFSEDGNGYDPGQTDSLENTALLSLIIDDLIRDVTQMNPRYGQILELLKQDYTKGEILDVLLPEYDLKKTQGYAEIKAAQKLAKTLYYQD